MQTVSQAWKDNQSNTIVSESFVELIYEIGDPESINDASASDNGSAVISNTSIITNLIDDTMAKYATFEHNVWKLDGSCKLLPDEAPYATGYVSNEICDTDGLFAVNPVITVTFSKVYTQIVPGITVRWGQVYNDYADSFKITVLNGVTEVMSRTVTGNSDTTSMINIDIVNYDKLTIEITKWGNPNRRARIEEIFVGIKRVFGKSDIIDYKHNMSVDLLSSKLPKSEIRFQLNNIDGKYNPYNLEGDSKYLIERQRIIVRYGYNINNVIEWIKAGTFYLSEWETPQNGLTASFKARDLFEFMNGRYTGTIANMTLDDIAVSALTQANLPLNRDGTVKWNLDESLNLITVLSADLPEDVRISEVLQMVANAGKCVLYQDRSEQLHIKPLVTTLTDYVIDTSNSYSYPELILTKKLKSVDVNKGMALVENDTDGEVQEVRNSLIQQGNALAVGTWVKNTLEDRKLIRGEYRSDPRLDPLDEIILTNKYASSRIVITDIDYSYNGVFKGKYEGRVL